MRICEITRGRYAVPKGKIALKPVYAKPPQPLPKPKKIVLTPLEIKNKQRKLQQAYANTVINTLAKQRAQNASQATQPIKPNSINSNLQKNSKDEMETFLKMVRGELPRDPHFDSKTQFF